jgi:predicted phage terminase large subunit-like protein
LREAETCKKYDPVKYARDFEGKWLNNSERAVLSKELLDLALEKVEEPVHYDQIVVAIDPAVSTNPNSDNTGIAVVGKSNGHFYLLHVEEKKWSPEQWSERAKQLYCQYSAHFIVYENNQGGNMVESTLRTVLGNFCKIKAVRATQNKVIRWEPCHALYEKNLVHHLGRFFDLETQMLTYSRKSKRPITKFIR